MFKIYTVTLHCRISIRAVVLLTLTVAIRSDSLQNRGKWHAPCGTGDTRRTESGIPTNKKTWYKELRDSLRSIQIQLNITIEHYRRQSFEKHYAAVRKGVDTNQYVPNWLPGKGNVLIYFDKPTRNKVAGYLPNLHAELQKFAVAMEAVIHNAPMTSSLNETNKNLMLLLCEVEEALVFLQIGVPAREQRTVMTEEERNLTDETNRLVRDWGILLKYKTYLNYWRRLLSNMENRRKKRRPKTTN